MTLQEFFRLLGNNPSYILLYFGLIPVTALLAGFLGSNEGHLSPWKYLYSALIYLVCIPGIFALTLNIYLFLFERRSVLESDIFSQILPVFSMVGTLLIIRRNVSFAAIPGFDNLSGLVTMITATFAFMWFIDRTHIYVFTSIPFWQVIVIFFGLFLVIRFGWSRLLKSSSNTPPQYQ
jgi:hypothetical protein